MIAFAWYLLKVMLCSGILFGYYWVALRNKKFHHYNRFYLLISLVLSWIIPTLKFDVYNSPDQPQIVKLLSVVSVGNAYVESTAHQVKNSYDWDLIALIAFASISFIILLKLVIGLIRINLHIRSSAKQKLDNIYLIFSNAKGTPFSFFKFIFWNVNIRLDSPDGQHILKHELAHVQEKHSADKLFINCCLIIGWYNPVLWLIKKELYMIHEFIADEKAIKDGDTATFASMILNAAYTPYQFSLSNPFFYSPIKRRLLMLTSSKSTRFTYIRRVAILPLLVFTFFIFAFNNKNQNLVVVDDSGINNSLLKPLMALMGDNKYQLSAAINKTSYNTINNNQQNTSSLSDTLIKSEVKHKWPWRKVILDGERMSWEEFEALNIPKTEFITTLFMDNNKGAFASRFGDEAKNGLAIFTTKKVYTQTGVTTEKGQKLIFTKDAKGKITTYTKDEAIVRFGFRPSDIEHWFAEENKSKAIDTVPGTAHNKIFTKVENPPSYKGDLSQYIQANLKYPSEAKNKKVEGKVMIRFIVDEDGALSDFKTISSLGNGLENEAIRLLKNSGPWKPAMQNGRKVVYEVKQEIEFALKTQDEVAQADQQAEFPGGTKAWKNYLERNLNAHVLATNQAPAGNYSATIAFNVSKNGTVSNLKAETKQGYGTEEESIRIIKNGPKWVPAKQDGKFIDSQVRQTITFMVTE